MKCRWCGWPCATGGIAIGFSYHRRYLDRRLSNTLRHNVIIRSQAQGAREAERERIAADFHDGPLQSFISFQMRLEIIKKLMARDVAAAADELRAVAGSVQEPGQRAARLRPQHASCRRWREPARLAQPHGGSISARHRHRRDLFERRPSRSRGNRSIARTAADRSRNAEQHSEAFRRDAYGPIGRRCAIIASRFVSEDNGGGFPFSGAFTLDELELLRLGPVSIKRRVRMLGGELQLESRPGEGASMQIRIPV